MVFIETAAFTRRVVALLSDDEYSRLQTALLDRPDAGAVIKGGGGIRKLRWGASGRGKSGGAQIIYYWQVTQDKILMLAAYAKGVQQDLTDEEVRDLRRVVEEGVR
jgi:hypothetical protein